MEINDVKNVAIGPNETNDAGDMYPTTESPVILDVGEPNKKAKVVKKAVKINSKDYAWLKKSRYEEEREKYSSTYVLQHKKFPNKIVELRASSALHACRMIHWKPQQVRVLETRVDIPDVIDVIHGRVEQTKTSTSLA